MQPITHKEIRYRILKTLHTSHPVPLTERNIYLTILPIFCGVTEGDIASEMAYLRDGEYISSEMKIDKARREKVWIHRITKHGIDLLEGSLSESDPGIDIPELG